MCKQWIPGHFLCSRTANCRHLLHQPALRGLCYPRMSFLSGSTPEVQQIGRGLTVRVYRGSHAGPSLPVATTPTFEDDLKEAARHLMVFHGAR